MQEVAGRGGWAALVVAVLLSACTPGAEPAGPHVAQEQESAGRQASAPASAAAADGRAPAAETDLGPLLDGLPSCALDGWYIDLQINRPAQPWLAAHAPTPCKVDEGFELATFCVRGRWKGLPIDGVLLPSLTVASVRGATIPLPLEQARAIARQQLGQEFRGDLSTEAGMSPMLSADPDDPQRSWLVCTSPAVGENLSAAGNVFFSGVQMPYRHDGCRYRGSPVDFCDAPHRARIEEAIAEEQPNFKQHYLLVSVPLDDAHTRFSLMLIDRLDGKVYPVPIDAMTGEIDRDGHAPELGVIETSDEDDTFCLLGALHTGATVENGRFCFGFDGQRFTGHRTRYMRP
ncbi:hypothetical protein [Stenotrophomonas sp. 24(2023)]|uniref:hypothetical protein n=1 Tax=Stenotrophomonas sp. 24(2023) TaxID=3068324 RepID=UPI0027DF8B3B|nr:hypothetical protein [Stenotrophomonas sp. 24(2023)]WMJ68253.1 hypothetical protein Q9R17_13720 [Stenotrophomonas sp. 24(2023)]